MNRRWLWAVLAAVLALPLWTLPHFVAQAAVVDVDFTRLAGPTRYSTSVQIAESYMDHVDSLPDAPRVDTVILGSGLDEHVGWVAPVPMLARLERAPLVFTRPDDVPVPVEQFLQRRAIRRVILLGGAGVISSAVERELGELGIETVERLGSDDIHLHAIEVAKSFDHPAGEFGNKGRTALLATSNAFADALAAGPMAYQGEYPILLTPPGSLHPAVFDYLVASDIDHVIILGGTAAVGAAVQRALAGLDFTTARIAGNDRYATAVELAETMLDRDDPLRPCFDGAELGLAYGGLSPDAIASGPLLGEQCAPLLLTPVDTLSRTVASFLRSDDHVTGDADNDLKVTVFGGTAVVPAEVVMQFVERATTLVPIGGRISVELKPDTEMTDKFTVFFNENINSERFAAAVGQGLFRINYERVFPTPSGDCTFTGTGIDENLLYGCVGVGRAAVNVRLSEELEVDDLITVTGGHRIGTNNSPRPTARFSYVVPEPGEPADRDAPEVKVIAPVGQSRLAVLVIEENPYKPALLTPAELAGRIVVLDAHGTRKDLMSDAAAPGPSSGAFGTRAKHERYVFALDDTTLEEGDAITVPRGVFLDEHGRANPQHRHVVPEQSVDFRIETVTVGDVDSTSQARVTLDAETQRGATPTGSLTIIARSDGIASGGRGSDWRVYGVGLPEPDDDDDDSDAEDVDCTDPDEQCVTVSVNRTTRVIAYRIHVGEPTFAELAEALENNRDFAANFIVQVAGVDGTGGTIGGTLQAGVQFEGGGTAVGLRVRFSDPVKDVLDSATPRAPLALRRASLDFDCKGIPLVADLVPRLTATSDGCTLKFDAPDQLLYMTLSAASVSRLPAPGDLVFINGGAAVDYSGEPNIAQGWLSIRYDSSVPSVPPVPVD